MRAVYITPDFKFVQPTAALVCLKPHHPGHVIVSSRWQICVSHDSASLWWKFNQLSYYTTSDLQICVVYERDCPWAVLNLSSIHHGIIDDYCLG